MDAGSEVDQGDLPRLAAAHPGTLVVACSDLSARLTDLVDTTIIATTSAPEGSLSVGGAPVREHCVVAGEMFRRTSSVDGHSYAIAFEMRLPKDWNGRFLHQGNGGLDGIVAAATGATSTASLTHALQRGFAVLSSDAGHQITLGPSFGIDPQARLDYGYQAVSKLTPMAKRVIEVAYGRGPDRSYFSGCSNGGRHALVAASRYPTEYDGILAGAPGYHLPKAAIASIAGAQLYATVATSSDLASAFTQDERATVASAVRAKCDALDGAADGLVQDVQRCRAAFDLQRDVPSCPDTRDGTCLSDKQKTVLTKIFAGVTTANGKPIYASFPYDLGIVGTAVSFWEFISPLVLDSGAVGLLFKVPPESPSSFDAAAFALSADLDALLAQIDATDELYTESAMSFATPPMPNDLSVLKNRGGKVIVYHGVSDPIFSVDDSENWYMGLQAENRGDPAAFARLFRIPGMGHCFEGPATDQFDALSSLVAWVEQGQAPDRIIASVRGIGNAAGANQDVPADWSPSRTRPLCPYPMVARYTGGDLESAASFSCQ